MTKVFASTLVIAAIAGGGFAYSATSGTAVPSGPLVWGGGHAVPYGDRQFSVLAAKTGGTFLYGRYGLPEPIVAGNVTCVNVSGNQAVIAGVITAAHYAPQAVGGPFLWYVRDNGGPAGAARDQVTAVVANAKPLQSTGLLPGKFAQRCPSALTLPKGLRFANLTAGDIVVRP